MRFRNWVWDEYGPFPDTDTLDAFAYDRGDELRRLSINGVGTLTRKKRQSADENLHLDTDR